MFIGVPLKLCVCVFSMCVYGCMCTRKPEVDVWSLLDHCSLDSLVSGLFSLTSLTSLASQLVLGILHFYLPDSGVNR